MPSEKGGLCMRGRIYSEQKFSLCGGILYHDEKRGGLSCKRHPKLATNKKFIVRFGRSITKRFQSYDEAARFLTGLRYENDKATFDERDYKKGHPLGFETQASKWLKVKKEIVKPNTYRNLKRDINKAISAWAQRNVKTIKYPEIEDFLYSLKVSEKTRANTRSVLHDF
jgi:hypothetical protein